MTSRIILDNNIEGIKDELEKYYNVMTTSEALHPNTSDIVIISLSSKISEPIVVKDDKFRFIEEKDITSGIQLKKEEELIEIDVGEVPNDINSDFIEKELDVKIEDGKIEILGHAGIISFKKDVVEEYSNQVIASVVDNVIEELGDETLETIREFPVGREEIDEYK